MNWKNIFKILGISLGVIVLILGGLAFWGLSKLPSAFEVKQSITPPALKDSKGTPAAAQDLAAAGTDLPAKEAESSTPTQTETHTAQIDDELQKQVFKVIREDFQDHRRPLIDACRSMDKAGDSGFLKDANNASGKYFFSSLSKDEKDPLTESVAPVMRTIFRAPGMDELFEMITKSDEEKDPSILKKAEFYYQIYRAGSYLKTHTDDLNRVMQQSYNMHALMKAVAQKPELARVPEVINFCEDLEKNLNNAEVFDAEASAEAMTSFLEENGLKPADIGFDPKYRSKVALNISNTQLNVSDAWIAKIFAADIEKSMKEKGK